MNLDRKIAALPDRGSIAPVYPKRNFKYDLKLAEILNSSIDHIIFEPLKTFMDNSGLKFLCFLISFMTVFSNFICSENLYQSITVL